MKTKDKLFKPHNVRLCIRNLGDVRGFFEDLKREDLGIHPDDYFVDCENLGISRSFAEKLDDAMLDCFKVCGEYGADIYDIAADVFVPELHEEEPKIVVSEKPIALTRKDETNLYLILSTEGYTEAPDGSVADMCQMLGISDGQTVSEAVDRLFSECPNLVKTGYSKAKTVGYEIKR